jgi:hypothetical protein
MLAQLITRAGGRARRIPHADVSRDRLVQVDFTGVEAIILSYLDLTTSTAHVRYLVRRLRQRCPRSRIIVGLWPETESAAMDRAPQIGADACVSTLRDALYEVSFNARNGRDHQDRSADCSTTVGTKG